MDRVHLYLLGVVLLFTQRAPEALGFSESSLIGPASPLENQAPVIEEEKAPSEQESPGGIATLPRPQPSQIDWPMPTLAVDILLGQANFTSSVAAAFPFTEYFSALFGWMIDTGESALGQRLTHGPTALAQLALPNMTTITPFLAAGPGYFFSRRTEHDGIDPDLAQEKVRSLGFIGRAGINLFLTRHFSLIMQQSYVMLETGLTTESHEEEKTIARTQMMFQFTF